MPWRLEGPDAATLETVRRLDRVARERGQSLAQMALTWCLRRPEVTSVLTAVSTLEQLEQAVAALDGPALSADELERIDAILAGGPAAV